MKISSKVECGMIALIDIAINSEGGEAVTVSGISQREGISPKYLEQILTSLRQAGLIKSIKGSKGGYVLSRKSAQITFDSVLNALDVTILSDNHDDSDGRSVIRTAVNEELIDKMTGELRTLTASITLDELAARCRSGSPGGGDYMYYI